MGGPELYELLGFGGPTVTISYTCLGLQSPDEETPFYILSPVLPAALQDSSQLLEWLAGLGASHG